MLFEGFLERDRAAGSQAVAVVREQGDAQSALRVQIEFAQQGVELNQEVAHFFFGHHVVEGVGRSQVGDEDPVRRG